VQNYGIIPYFDLFLQRKNGGRSTVDPRPGPGGALAGATEPGSLPRVGEKERSSGGGGVLTEGFGGRFDGEARPAAVKVERRQ
jgi:hypothetical protein